ncbi:MAG: GTPase HflX [Actinomycetota bacterium]
MSDGPASGRRSRRPVERQVLESPLSATWRPPVREKAVLVGVGPGIEEADLDELSALADSAGAESVARIVQSRHEPDPATFIGRGKLEEVHERVHRSGADSVILDQELSPGQLRSLEERLGVKVIDRTALILDIFALHARSREGKAQVELAQLNYLVPRLRGWGEAMSRAGGGIGTRFGGGETKMEVDRQHIRRRITKLRRELTSLARTRETKRSRRQGSAIPQAAIAGYTNAGKSTLMNRLTGADVVVADQLFATLDPTVRRLRLPGGRRCTISDTVGFVSKLPHDLVEAFRSTLEEVTLAELVVHVADASSPDLREQIDAVRRVLDEIGAGAIPEILVMNKIDRLTGSERARLARRHPGSVPVSALSGEGIDGLLETLEATLPKPPVEVELLVPYGREDVTALLYRDAEVVDTSLDDTGTIVHARVGLRELAAVRAFVRRERRTG